MCDKKHEDASWFEYHGPLYPRALEELQAALNAPGYERLHPLPETARKFVGCECIGSIMTADGYEWQTALSFQYGDLVIALPCHRNQAIAGTAPPDRHAAVFTRTRWHERLLEDFLKHEALSVLLYVMAGSDLSRLELEAA